MSCILTLSRSKNCMMSVISLFITLTICVLNLYDLSDWQLVCHLLGVLIFMTSPLGVAVCLLSI